MCMIVAYKGIVRVLEGIWCECVECMKYNVGYMSAGAYC